MEKIDESLVDVMFKTFRSNIQVRDLGVIVEFRFGFTETKTILSLKIRKNTLRDIKEWFDKIIVGVL